MSDHDEQLIMIVALHKVIQFYSRLLDIMTPKPFGHAARFSDS